MGRRRRRVQGKTRRVSMLWLVCLSRTLAARRVLWRSRICRKKQGKQEDSDLVSRNSYCQRVKIAQYHLQDLFLLVARMLFFSTLTQHLIGGRCLILSLLSNCQLLIQQQIYHARVQPDMPWQPTGYSAGSPENQALSASLKSHPVVSASPHFL